MRTSSALRLVEPDFWTCPHGKRQRPEKVQTFGPEVADLCAAANFAPDPQQELGLDLIFAFNPDGSPATFEFCVICARQNLKTGLLLQAVIGWLYVLEVPEIAWSAHELSTALGSQRDLARIMRDAPVLQKRMLPQRNEGIYSDNGSERIELKDQTVWFKARTRDGSRGLGKPKVILDEGFALKAAMLGALVPILLAQYHPQLLVASSPGKADSRQLRDIRTRGRAGSTRRMTYLEWGGTPLPECADPKCTHPKTGLTHDDPCVLNRIEVIERRNPTLTTGRITLETMASVRQILPNDEWLRECLGRWEDPSEDDVADGVFGTDWDTLPRFPVSEPFSAPVLAVASTIELSATCISAAERVGERYRGKPIAYGRGTTWAIDELVSLEEDRPGLIVVIDGKGPASGLIEPLQNAGVSVQVIGLNDAIEACTFTQHLVEDQMLDVPEGVDLLDKAEDGATWRSVGDRRLFGRKSGHDITALESLAFALWGTDNAAVSTDAWGFFE